MIDNVRLNKKGKGERGKKLIRNYTEILFYIAISYPKDISG